MDAVIRPYGTLDFLTQREISELSGPDEGPLKKLFHRCALAVLNTGEETDSSLEVMERYREFEIRVIQETRGIKLELKNAPQSAFVDGKLMYSIRDHLFSVLRDIVYIVKEQESRGLGAETQSPDITDFIYHILRNAGALKGLSELNMAVCWGGFHQPGGIRIHQGSRSSTRIAGFQHLHRMRTGSDERSDERGCHRPRETAQHQRMLSRVDGTRHHCLGITKPDRQFPGGDA